jgi:PAS domain-containing protein
MTAASFGDIQSLGILQFFETDPRPTFLFDITINSLESIPIEYSNPILQNNSLLSRQLKTGVDCGGNWPSFKAWVTDTIEDDDPLHDPQPTFTFVGNVWSRNTLLNRWRVISANAAESRPHKRQRKRQISSSPSSRQIPTFGKQGPGTYPSVPRDVVARPIIEEGQSWSLPPKGEDPTKYIEFFRSVDWSVTALGPMENWPRRLHEMADLVLRDSRPCALYWGPDYTIIYNSAYAGLTGSKHPGLMGKTCADAWPEASSALIGTMERARISGVASLDDEWQLFLDRLECGKLEETYFSWSLVPIYDGDECPGFLGPVFETTKHRIAQRRIWLINKLGEYMAEATSVRSFWEKTFQGLMVADSTDLPLVLLYSVADEGDSSTGSGESRIFCLEGALGIPDGGHQLAPVRLDLFRDQAGLAPYFKSAIRLGRPLLIAIADIEPSSLESLQWRGFGDACTHAVICPIRPTKDENVMGLLMIGLNPRRPYDFEYNEFISILSQKLATTLASSVLFEEEVRRGRNAAQQAAFDQAKLFELLAIRTKEADESTRRFQIFSEAVPTGLCFSRPDGTISYANDVWYKLTSFVKGKDVITIDNISNCVFDDDRSFAMDQQRKVLSTGETISYELRLKDLSTGSPDVSKWILCTSSAERDSKGSIEAVITCLTDITASKKATEEANFRAQQAERLSEKLSRFRRMAETSTVGLFDLDFDGNILEANDAFYTVMNMRKDGSNITPQATWVDAILEEDVSKAIQNLDDLTVQGKAVSAELRVRHAAPDDGVAETRNIQSWVLCTAMPLRNSEGEMVGFTGCVTDITSQKFRAQNTDERAALLDQLLARTEEAKSSEEKFTHFAQAAPIGIAINDPDGNINFCNETWYQITSYPRDLPLNGPVSWVVLVLDEDLPIIVNAWETLSAKKEAISIEFRLKNPWIVPGRSADKGSKAERWISCSSVPEIDDAGAVKSVMSCMSDISHFKWAESIEKQRAVEALESKRQQESNCLAILSMQSYTNYIRLHRHDQPRNEESSQCHSPVR